MQMPSEPTQVWVLAASYSPVPYGFGFSSDHPSLELLCQLLIVGGKDERLGDCWCDIFMVHSSLGGFSE
jgi:hypothetical protein